MSIYNVFDIAGSGMKAQSTRLTTTASNMSNSNVVSGTQEGAYKAKYPIFTPNQSELNDNSFSLQPGVKVEGIFQSQQPAIQRYQPSHPLANEKGYVFMPNVNMVEEMTNMMSASKAYRMNAEILTTVKELMARTLQLGE